MRRKSKPCRARAVHHKALLHVADATCLAAFQRTYLLEKHPVRQESKSAGRFRGLRGPANAGVAGCRVVRIAPNRAAAPRDSRFGQNERLGDSAIR